MTETRAVIGTSAWSKPGWRDSFYPPGLAQARELAYLAARLRTVEINTTFYSLQSESTFQKWHDAVPERFVFAVKGNREITHTRRLRGAEQEIAAFLAAGPLLLRAKLGPFLWQIQDDFAFDAAVLDGFFALLPRSVDEARHFIARHGGAVGAELAAVPDRPLRHALEVRHPSFRHPRYLELLRRHGVAAVLTNPRSGPVIDAVTADFVYARIGDERERFPDGQSDADLERHAARIRGWRDGVGGGTPHDVFFYFDDPDYRKPGQETDRPPFDAMELQRRVGGEAPAPGITQQTSLW